VFKSIILPQTTDKTLHVGILSAMPEEVGVILENLKDVKKTSFGDLELFSGEFQNNNSKKIYITTAWSGWGKVSAARATTRLLPIIYKNIPISLVLFTGVAGAVDKKLKQWDIVISESVIQHDIDARPLFEKYVIPAIKKKEIFTNKILLDKIFDSISGESRQNNLNSFGRIYKGLIATGDMFISEKKKIIQLSKDISGLLAVEMEGAAFAQVAHQEKIEWIIIRVISDDGDEKAGDDFNNFLIKYKNQSFELIKSFLNSITDKN